MHAPVRLSCGRARLPFTPMPRPVLITVESWKVSFTWSAGGHACGGASTFSMWPTQVRAILFLCHPLCHTRRSTPAARNRLAVCSCVADRNRSWLIWRSHQPSPPRKFIGLTIFIRRRHELLDRSGTLVRSSRDGTNSPQSDRKIVFFPVGSVKHNIFSVLD